MLLCLSIAACSAQPVINDEMMHIEGAMPADLSGSWQRNYLRGDEVNAVLYRAYYQLGRSSRDLRYARSRDTSPASSKDMASVLALARLADLITRPDVLTISQTEYELSVAREDDYAIFCAFYDGLAKATDSDYGTELCGWDGSHLVSHLVLPDGLEVIHRFTVSEDGDELRVVTTVSSSASPVPFTLQRFYTKFERLPGEFNCIETLSMKRVCSTGEIVP